MILSLTSCNFSQGSSVSNNNIPVEQQAPSSENSMNDQVFYTIQWTIGIEFFDASYNSVAKNSKQVLFTVPKLSQNVHYISDAEQAAVVELSLNENLHLCYLILRSVDNNQQKTESLDLYGWLYGNWIVNGASVSEPVEKPIPGTTIDLKENPRKEIVDRFFVNWDGKEYEYTLFSQFEVIDKASVKETELETSNVLKFKPIEEAKKCIANSPQVVLKSIESIL